MGALGPRTSLPFGTAVTCPGFRYHPAVIAHAAATLGAMFPDRFWLGLGAGEALNEHVIGGVWPEVGDPHRDDVRGHRGHQQAVHRRRGRHDGKHFTLESAKLYTRPETPGAIYVATAGPVNAKRTGKFADGMITVGAADEKMRMIWGKFEEGAREAGKDPTGAPKLLQIHISWAPTEEEAIQKRSWSGPTAACPSRSRTSRTRRTSRRMAKLVRPRTSRTGCSSAADLEAHTAQIQQYVDMGFDEVHLHNVGRNQAEFIEVFGREVIPNLRLG